MYTAANLNGKRTVSDAFDLSEGDDHNGDTRANLDQRRTHEDRVSLPSQDLKVGVGTGNIHDTSSANLIVAQEQTPFDVYTSKRDVELAYSTTGEGVQATKIRQMRVLESARFEHETNVQTLEARLRIGERGLGSLARQLHEIQVAMKRREGEIERIVLERERERAAAVHCEAMIEAIRRD